ncbi:alpha/beta fold hydrolase, partial [Delftia acidovorans]
MVTTCIRELPHGIHLHCRVSGEPGRPLLLFLHGFPEDSFIWEGMLEQFGAQWRCVAPDLRGFGHSSQPAGVEQYKAKHLLQDLAALIAIESPGAPA